MNAEPLHADHPRRGTAASARRHGFGDPSHIPNSAPPSISQPTTTRTTTASSARASPSMSSTSSLRHSNPSPDAHSPTTNNNHDVLTSATGAAASHITVRKTDGNGYVVVTAPASRSVSTASLQQQQQQPPSQQLSSRATLITVKTRSVRGGDVTGPVDTVRSSRGVTPSPLTSQANNETTSDETSPSSSSLGQTQSSVPQQQSSSSPLKGSSNHSEQGNIRAPLLTAHVPSTPPQQQRHHGDNNHTESAESPLAAAADGDGAAQRSDVSGNSSTAKKRRQRAASPLTHPPHPQQASARKSSSQRVSVSPVATNELYNDDDNGSAVNIRESLYSSASPTGQEKEVEITKGSPRTTKSDDEKEKPVALDSTLTPSADRKQDTTRRAPPPPPSPILPPRDYVASTTRDPVAGDQLSAPDADLTTAKEPSAPSNVDAAASSPSPTDGGGSSVSHTNGGGEWYEARAMTTAELLQDAVSEEEAVEQQQVPTETVPVTNEAKQQKEEKKTPNESGQSPSPTDDEDEVRSIVKNEADDGLLVAPSPMTPLAAAAEQSTTAGEQEVEHELPRDASPSVRRPDDSTTTTGTSSASRQRSMATVTPLHCPSMQRDTLPPRRSSPARTNSPQAFNHSAQDDSSSLSRPPSPSMSLTDLNLDAPARALLQLAGGSDQAAVRRSGSGGQQGGSASGVGGAPQWWQLSRQQAWAPTSAPSNGHNSAAEPQAAATATGGSAQPPKTTTPVTTSSSVAVNGITAAQPNRRPHLLPPTTRTSSHALPLRTAAAVEPIASQRAQEGEEGEHTTSLAAVALQQPLPPSRIPRAKIKGATTAAQPTIAASTSTANQQHDNDEEQDDSRGLSPPKPRAMAVSPAPHPHTLTPRNSSSSSSQQSTAQGGSYVSYTWRPPRPCEQYEPRAASVATTAASAGRSTSRTQQQSAHDLEKLNAMTKRPTALVTNYANPSAAPTMQQSVGTRRAPPPSLLYSSTKPAVAPAPKAAVVAAVGVRNR